MLQPDLLVPVVNRFVGTSLPEDVPGPVVVTPRPVYVAPPPVYVEPRPVYVAPRPVYVAPRPVYHGTYYGPRRW